MPAIIAHHLFGLEMHAHLAPLIGEGKAQREAFLLGNEGPDPFFCLLALPTSADYRTMGSVMHAQRTDELLAQMHRSFIGLPADADDVLKPYALGFLCHYLLDASVHPLVYAQQYALCDAGVEGLSREHGCRETHALIETEFDEYLLTTKLNTTVATFVPHRETLRCEEDALQAISAAFSPVASEVYSIPLPQSAFWESVWLYRLGQLALDSKRDGLRRFVDYARIAGDSYLHIQALTHTAQPRLHTDFANDDHFPWPHPYEPGAVISSSFDELYEAAFQRALNLLPQFADSGFSAESCWEIATQTNFNGKLI